MNGIEERLRALERQVSRYRILNRMVTIAVLLVLLGCAAYVLSNLLRLQRYVKPPAEPIPGGSRDSTLRAKRVEIFDEAASRPVCVLRADDGGGRIEVFNRTGTALAGFDGNQGLVVRSVDGPRFPETRAPK